MFSEPEVGMAERSQALRQIRTENCTKYEVVSSLSPHPQTPLLLAPTLSTGGCKVTVELAKAIRLIVLWNVGEGRFALPP